MHLLTVNMKNSSTNTAPNGRMPAIRDLCLKGSGLGGAKIEDDHALLKRCALIRKMAVVYLRKDGVEVPDLLRNLARNLIGSYRMFIGLLAKAKVEPSEHKGKRDSKPEAE